MRFLKQSKKFLVSIMCVFTMLVIVGCSGKGANSKTYTMEENGHSIEVVIGHKENEITAMDLNMKLPLKELDGTNAMAKEFFEDFSGGFKMLKGFEMSFNTEKDFFVVKAKVDYSKIDVEKFKKIAMMGAMSGRFPMSDFDNPESSFEDFKDFSKMESNLKLAGFTEKK